MHQPERETDHLYFLGDVCVQDVVALPSELSPLVINLEGPLTCATTGAPGKVNLRNDATGFMATFRRNRIAAVCLANNHILDYGADGLADTLRTLGELGIGYFGAGCERDNFANPCLLKIGGARIGLLGYVCRLTRPVIRTGEGRGCAELSSERVRHDIELAHKLGAERVVLNLHWGAEEVYLPSLQQVETARNLASTGVALIVSHHSHIVQPVECWQGAPIYYGLGNAIMPHLDVPCCYGPDGLAARRFQKHQARRNLESLVVKYTPHLERVTTLTARYVPEEQTVHVMRSSVPGSPLSTAAYAVRRKVSFAAGKFKAARAATSGRWRPVTGDVGKVVRLVRRMFWSSE